MIKRSPRKQTYTILNNVVYESNLSLAALGALCLLLSKPDHWKVNTTYLVNYTEKSAKHSKRDAVRKIITELMEKGFLTRERKRTGGTFDGYDYTVYDEPQPLNNPPAPENPAPVDTGEKKPAIKPESQDHYKSEKTENIISDNTDSPETDFPAPAKPAPDSPAPANPTLVITETAVITEVEKKDKDIGASTDAPPKKAPFVYPGEFEWIWSNRPPREGAESKRRAHQCCNARIKQGATWRELAEGMRRYYAYCKTKGNLHTEFVMQMGTFFGPDEHYKNTWGVTTSKTDPDFDDTDWRKDIGEL
jgi:hypothetical protein